MHFESRASSLLSLCCFACLLGACATAPLEPGQDQGPLALTMPPDAPTVTIHPTRVTVKNGRGEVLLDGVPDKDNQLTGNPAPNKFDGTLDITTQYDNGTSKTQTLTHDPARSMSLAWDDTTKQYVVRQAEAPKPADKFVGEPGWAIQIFADYKQTPYSDTTVSSSGSTVTGKPDLSDSMSSLGFGVRRYFAAMPNGFQPFAYAGFSEYFGNGARAADVTYHFGTTPDTGGEIKEQRSFLLGGGGQFLLGRNMALQLMVGLHATRVQASVFSDETSGGGPNNIFTSNKWMFGPAAGAGLAFPLLYFSNGSPLVGFLQYHAMMMDDVSENVTSPFTSQTYSLNANGGIQHKVMFGVEKRF